MKKILFTILTILSFCFYGFSQTTTNFGTDSGTLGDYNSFFGYQAGKITTGDYNVFLGFASGKKNTIGTNNVFIGWETGSKNTTANDNTFIGWRSGRLNTTGIKNTFLGSSSGNKNTIGSHNVFMGNGSGDANTTGENNTFSGTYSGVKNVSGDDNAFFGSRAGYNSVSGIQNTYLGSVAGYGSTGSRNVFIGYRSGKDETSSDKLYIDNSDTATPLLYGDFATNQLGINTNTIPTGYAFAVKGKIMSEEITVKIFPWADFVFEENYKLPTLKEVEQHILKNGHLQDIPNAKEVAQNGVNVGEMESLLLQKIEELTLYTIQQEKKIEEQELRLQKLEALITK